MARGKQISKRRQEMTNLEKAKELASRAEKALYDATVINALYQVTSILTKEEKAEYNKWLLFKNVCRKTYTQCLSKDV